MKSKEELQNLQQKRQGEVDEFLKEHLERIHNLGFPYLFDMIVSNAEKKIIDTRKNPVVLSLNELREQVPPYEQYLEDWYDNMPITDMLDNMKLFYGLFGHPTSEKLNNDFMQQFNELLQKTGNFAVLAESNEERVLVVGDGTGFNGNFGASFKPVTKLPPVKLSVEAVNDSSETTLNTSTMNRKVATELNETSSDLAEPVSVKRESNYYSAKNPDSSKEDRTKKVVTTILVVILLIRLITYIF